MKSKKKELGQFFTEPAIARFMVKLVLENNLHNVLDPAVGMGVFTQIITETHPNLDITVCEIDPEMITKFKMRISISTPFFNKII